MSFEEKLEEERIFQRKFTKDYKNLKQEEKDILDFSLSMCNIWGYIKDLEKRIKKLEGK